MGRKPRANNPKSSRSFDRWGDRALGAIGDAGALAGSSFGSGLAGGTTRRTGWEGLRELGMVQ
ncbi:MAG: hypothetical protein HC916_19675 [Coleofasciculaceae cyanobacterium SM2_1_6]|nr:hypothetical protein [Coleofasciculaceae cyanobacterium SM2_1_6]